ncbi:MAG: (Fe-S)-binding protein [Proteobacteria bacterium]|nr:(Fe-S)-binding protein [Pseudomonadota bacterium]MDA1057672.1 (Fe-S)-binding protein [Pseudomonadota bacterium]
MTTGPRVALFVTCLVDLFRPSVGFAAVKLLEDAGCTVVVPVAQTCCGQPAYNAGDRKDARAIAANVLRAFAGFDYVIAPSGSCAGMIKHHYPRIFAGDPVLERDAIDLAGRTWELASFLVDVLKVAALPVRYDGTVAYHDSCSALREMGVRDQPRVLLSQVAGLTLAEVPNGEVCCGFGGTFSVKYGDISGEIVRKKAGNVVDTGADTLVAGDLGCLFNIAGKLKRDGSTIAVRHVAEILAGMTDDPAIGEA